MTRKRATVLFVEDELSLREEFPRVIERRGHRVVVESGPDDVLRIVREESRIDAAIIDLQLPMEGCREIGLQEAAGGREAGLIVASEFRKKFKRAPVIFWTNLGDRQLRTRILRLGNSRLIPKAGGPDLVLDALDEALDGFRSGARPKTFIVHGHDEHSMRSVKEYLQTMLRFPEPVVLRDMPSHGRTIIEKLESYAATIDLVFVLLTPDDRAVSSGASADELYRSRQNVIFEMGYFLGVLGRTTGRVVLLYRRPIELPSDITGIVCIDITDGVEAASPAIMREVAEWL
jgi:DNA-binding NarL/FixJ family response regulator